MEKEEEKRGERGRKYNCMAAVYAGFPTLSCPAYFRGKMLQIQCLRGMRKDKEMERKRRKKEDSLYAAVLINLLSLGGGNGKEKDPENKRKSPFIPESYFFNLIHSAKIKICHRQKIVLQEHSINPLCFWIKTSVMQSRIHHVKKPFGILIKL